MVLKEFTGLTEEAHKLLFDDFSAEQIFPAERFDNARKNGHYNIYYFCDDSNNRIGYAFCGYAGENAVLLDYIGISKELRGKGMGSKLIIQLRKILSPKGVLVEVEPEPEGGTPTESRYRFYKRLGFEKQNISYILPERDEENNVILTPYSIFYGDSDHEKRQLGAGVLIGMFREYTEKVLPGAMPEIKDIV